MIRGRKLNVLLGIIAGCLFITLLCKLNNIPGGMILPGFFFGGILLIVTLIAVMVLTSILTLIFKNKSTISLLLVTMSVGFLILHYYLYSPTLMVKVPKGYRGEVFLVLSNLEDNLLTLDSNGVGYINKWTFDKTYTRPIVEEIGGRNLDEILVAYNPSTFFSNGTSCCVEGKEVKFLSFEIKSENTDDTDLYIPNHFPETVNKKFAIFSEPKGSNKMQTIMLE